VPHSIKNKSVKMTAKYMYDGQNSTPYSTMNRTVHNLEK